jgi:hypothetical protein
MRTPAALGSPPATLKCCIWGLSVPVNQARFGLPSSDWSSQRRASGGMSKQPVPANFAFMLESWKPRSGDKLAVLPRHFICQSLTSFSHCRPWSCWSASAVTCRVMTYAIRRCLCAWHASLWKQSQAIASTMSIAIASQCVSLLLHMSSY